jgi:hypothetical protein
MQKDHCRGNFGTQILECKESDLHIQTSLKSFQFHVFRILQIVVPTVLFFIKILIDP